MRIRFWKGRRQNDDDLVSGADWQAEQAGLALRDGELHHAIRWSDWTVTHTREIWARWRKRGRDERRVTEVLADRLRDRALIHHGLGNIGEAIRDATEALALFEEGQRVHGVRYPLLVPSCQVLLSELYAQAGDAAAARRHGRAIEAYERGLAEGPSLALARGYNHYGRAMHLIGDPAAAPALRHAVDLYRHRDVLPDGRYTAGQFIQTVLLVADTAKPVNAAAAPEILSMLEDAATYARQLPQFPPRQYYADLYVLRRVQVRMAAWRETLDAP
ncbi:hypothetical protein [Streptomyces sp. NPDC096132]|uniref:hypothetical protein n=1 Tax=Streptomyces sp. NPDC096132 TaxID=3366075 RepID=UPI00382C15F8